MMHFNHPASACREAPPARFRFQASHFTCQRRGGFTLMEMMVVVLIIAILAGITAVAVNSAKEKARQTDCMSNLRQLGTAIVTYRADNRGRNPDWLSNLYPTYIDDKRVFVCRSDTKRGMGPLRPDDPTLYSEVIDNDYTSRHDKQNAKDIKANSYFYEFNAARCSWGSGETYAQDIDGDGIITWSEVKEGQLARGNTGDTPYSSSRLPIVRCYHHISYGRIGAKKDGGSIKLEPITLNVAYAGNVVIAPLKWEESVEPGEE